MKIKDAYFQVAYILVRGTRKYIHVYLHMNIHIQVQIVLSTMKKINLGSEIKRSIRDTLAILVS